MMRTTCRTSKLVLFLIYRIGSLYYNAAAAAAEKVRSMWWVVDLNSNRLCTQLLWIVRLLLILLCDYTHFSTTSFIILFFASISAFIAQLCCFCTTSSRILSFSYFSTIFISILSFRLSRATYIEAGASFRIRKQAKAKAKRMDECKRAVLISCFMQADHILKIAMSRYSCYIFKYTWNTIYIEIWHCRKYIITIRNHRVLMTLYEE